MIVDIGFVALFSTAEVCFGILNACLPTLRPLLKAARARVSSTVPRTMQSGVVAPKAGDAPKIAGTSPDNHAFLRLRDSQEYLVSVRAEGGTSGLEPGNIPMDSIGVTLDVHWHEERV